MRPMTPWRMGGLVLLCAASAGVAGAQARSGWLPRSVKFESLTPTQRASAIATLEKVERLLRQVPELANPDGFEIVPSFSGGMRHTGPNSTPLVGSVAEYGLALSIYAPSRAAAGEGCSCLAVRINARQSGNMKDAQGRLVYIEDARAMKPNGTPREVAGTLWEVPSATQVYGELWDFTRDIREGRGERSGVRVVFVTAGELPWQPVSREDFYAAVQLERAGKDGQRTAEVRNALAKTPYEQWMAEAPERNRIRQEQVAAARQTMTPDKVAAFKQQLEDTDAQVTAQLRMTHDADQARNRDGLALQQRMDDAFAQELAAMTPEERRMPTYINNALQEGPFATGWRLTSDPSPPAWRVLTPNYDFWRARRSPVEVHTIEVQIGISGTGLRPKVRQALLQAFRTIDWAAFNQLLDAPR